MDVEDILSGRLAILREIVRNGFEDAPAQVQGLIVRMLKRENRYVNDVPLYRPLAIDDCLAAVRFDGYPALARAGYNLACTDNRPIDAALADRFLQGVELQQSRPVTKQAELGGDSVALLGICDGLRAISQSTLRRAEGL